MAGFSGFYQLLALADFISGWLWRTLSVAGFSEFYKLLALADFISDWLWWISSVAGFGGFYPTWKRRSTGQVGFALSVFRGWIVTLT